MFSCSPNLQNCRSWSIWDFASKTPSPKRRSTAKILAAKALATTQAAPPPKPKPKPMPALPTQPLPPARIVQGPFRYNPTLSQQKSTYVTTKKMQMGFVRNFGLFRATTDAFYTSPKYVEALNGDI